jgi:hypothetical protein
MRELPISNSLKKKSKSKNPSPCYFSKKKKKKKNEPTILMKKPVIFWLVISSSFKFIFWKTMVIYWNWSIYNHSLNHMDHLHNHGSVPVSNMCPTHCIGPLFNNFHLRHLAQGQQAKCQSFKKGLQMDRLL